MIILYSIYILLLSEKSNNHKIESWEKFKNFILGFCIRLWRNGAQRSALHIQDVTASSNLSFWQVVERQEQMQYGHQAKLS